MNRLPAYDGNSIGLLNSSAGTVLNPQPLNCYQPYYEPVREIHYHTFGVCTVSEVDAMEKKALERVADVARAFLVKNSGKVNTAEMEAALALLDGLRELRKSK